ncbi:hypothetical protein [Clostridium sp. CCUG 7971]|uniref:hypothetical protein n=1 Tax=Clostridium sp. CCUG 7971 TaxID=2811414 RepID=UPI001ABA9000|nr:hypothetical protein [Clostridium sp. CCUG 7971]MBO3445612.1 hypothetical protein [Clostridium sp. CCUG 7971]
MNKKLSIFAIILVIIGGIGTVYSGIKSIPYFTNKAYEIQKEMDKEEIIYNEQIDINKLNINTINAHVLIKKHNENSVKITKRGMSNYDIQNNNKELAITEKELERKNNYNFKVNNLDDLIDLVKSDIYRHRQDITIYIPNNVDLNVSAKYGSLNIIDNVALNNIEFKTIYGAISLPKGVKNLKGLDIVSKSNIRLSMGEILGIENINIAADSINVYSSDDDIFIDNIEKYIPNNVNLNIQSYGDVYITTDIPMANNFNINGHDSQVKLDIPVNKYKFNVDMKASENIDIEDSLDNNNSQNNIIREIKGTLNKKLESLETEYKININAQNINIL